MVDRHQSTHGSWRVDPVTVAVDVNPATTKFGSIERGCGIVALRWRGEIGDSRVYSKSWLRW